MPNPLIDAVIARDGKDAYNAGLKQIQDNKAKKGAEQPKQDTQRQLGMLPHSTLNDAPESVRNQLEGKPLSPQQPSSQYGQPAIPKAPSAPSVQPFGGGAFNADDALASKDPYRMMTDKGQPIAQVGTKKEWKDSGVVQPYEVNPYKGKAVLPYSTKELRDTYVTLQNDGRFLLDIRASKIKGVDGSRDFSVENFKEVPQSKSQIDNYRILDSEGLSQSRKAMGKFYNVPASKLYGTPEAKAELDRRNAQVVAVKIIGLSNGDLSYNDFQALRRDILNGRGNVYSYNIADFIASKREQKGNILADHKAQGNAMLSRMKRIQSDREKATGKSDYYRPMNTPVTVGPMYTSDLADAHALVSMRMDRSLDMLDIVEKKARGEKGWLSLFGEGVGEGLAYELLPSASLGHVRGSDYLQNLIKRYNKGEKLNKEDSALLDAFAYSNTIDSEMVRYIPSSYKIGETTGASIPFMIDFLTANAVAGVGEIGAKVGAKLTQKTFQAMLRNGILDSSRGLTRFGAKLLGGVARVATDAGVAGIMTAANPRQMGKIASNAYEMLEEKPLASTSRSGAPKFGGVTLAPQETSKVKAFAESFTDQWIENWSEMAGGWLGDIGKGTKNFGKAIVGGAFNDVKKAAPQMMANYGSSSIGGALTQGYKAAVNIGKKAGFNGVVEENLEEYFGNAARVMILGGDHTWDREFSPEQIKETFVGLLPTMLMFGAIGGVSTAGQHATSARQLKEYEDKLKARGIDTDKAREQMSNMSFNEYVQHEAALLTKARIKHAEAEALLERKDAGANKAMEAAKEAEEKAMFALYFAKYQGVRGVDTEAIQEAREAHEREVDRSIDNSVKSVSHLLSQEHNPDNTPNPTAGTYSRVEHNGKEYVVRNGKFKAVAQRDMESGAPIKDRNGNVSYEVDADELLYLQDANGNVVPVYSSDVTPLGETIRLDGLKNSAKSILMSDASGGIQPSAIIDESTLRELSDPNNNLPYVQAEPSAFVSSEEVEQAQSDIAGMEPQGEQQEQVPQGVPQIEGGVDDNTESSPEEESFVLNDDEEQDQGEWDNLDDYDPNRPIEVGDDVLFDSDGRGDVKTGVVSQVSDDAYYIQAHDGGMYVIPLEQGIWHNMFNRRGGTPKEHNTQEQESGVVDTTSPEEVVPEDQQEADPQTAEEWVAYFDGDIESAINWIENTIRVLKKDLSKLEKKGKKVNAGETPSEYKARIQESRVVIDAIRAKIEENEGILSDLQSMLVDKEAEEPQEETNKSEEVNEVEEEDVAPIEESEEEEENPYEETHIEEENIPEENESEEAATSTTKDDSVEEEEPIAQPSEEEEEEPEKEAETTETTTPPTESEKKSQKEDSEDEKTDGGQESKPSQEEGSNHKLENKTASEVLDEVVAENANRPKQKSKKQGSKKEFDSSVWAFTTEDPTRPVLAGVYHDGGYAVATNMCVLIAEKAAYEPSKEGSVVDRKGDVIDARFPRWRAIIPENLDSFNMNFGILVDKLREVRSKIEKEILADRGLSRISPKIKNEASGSVISVRFPNGVDLQFKLGYMESFANAAVRLGITEMGVEKGQDCYRIFAQNKNGILACVTIHLGRNTPSIESIDLENVAQEEKEARAIVGSVFATPLTNGSIGVLRIIGEEGGKFVYSTDVVLKTGVDTSRHVESIMSRSSLMSYYPWNYLELPSDIDITDTNAVFEAFEKAENDRKSLLKKSGSSRVLHKMSKYGETVYVHSMNLPFRGVLSPCFFASMSKSPLRYGDAGLVRLRKYWREEDAIDVANETLSYLHEANKKEEEERKKEEERERLAAEEKAAKDEELNQKYKGYLSNKLPMQRARIIKQLEHKFLSVGDESLSVFDYIIRMWENGTLKLEEESFVESQKNKHLETIDKNVHEYKIYDTNGHTYYVITKTSYDFAKYLEGLEKDGEEKSEVGRIEKQRSADELRNDTAAKQLATNAVLDALDSAGISVEVVSDETASRMLGETDTKAESGNEEDLGTTGHVQFMRTGGKKKSAPETASPATQDHQTVVSSADGAKVLNELENLVKEYENSKGNKPNTFIGDVSKALGAKRQGSASEYASFETKSGKTVTIRLSNHNAKVSTFDAHHEAEGISIVVTPKENNGISNDGNAHVTEFYYNAIKLRRADGKPLVEILKSIKQALYSGAYTDNTGLAEVKEVNVPTASNGQTDSGKVYGWTVGGKIFLTKDGINPNTPIHEYTHLWANAMRQRNAKGWQCVKDLLKGTPIWNEVLNDPNYRSISGDEDAVASEALSRISGRENAKKMEAEAQRMIDEADGIGEQAEAVTLLDRMRRALDAFWHWTGKNLFGIKNFESIEEVTDRVLYDLTTGTDLQNDRSLMAVHNISVDKLQSALEFGGFPMPSIAITNADMGHAGYGDISLVFARESIDPSDSRNKVYSGDAWTPTFPQIGYKLNDKKANEIYRRANAVDSLPLFDPVYFHPDTYKGKIDRHGDASLVDYFKDDYGAKQMFLAEKGNAVREFVQHEVKKYTPEKVSRCKKILETIGLERLKNDSLDSVKNDLTALGINGSDFKYKMAILAAIYYAEHGNTDIAKDVDATQQEIDKRIDTQSFSAWLEELFSGVVEKKGIRNDRDTFTPSGSRRKWESLYDAVTLENVIKYMRQQSKKGGNGFFNSSIFGASTKELPSIDAIRREAKLRINSISNEKMEKAKGRIIDRLGKVSIPSAKKSISGTFDFMENVIDAVSKSHTPSGIYKYLHTYYPDMTMDVAKEISDIVSDIQKMSMRYFEAKPYRAVGFDEVRAAVVPNGVPQEIIEGLQKRGIKVVSYEKGNEQERKDALSAVTREMDIRFQIKGNHEKSGAATITRLIEQLKKSGLAEDVIVDKEAFEKKLEEVDNVQFLKDGEQVYGFVSNGIVYLNPDLLNTNTPIHEFAHLWNSLIKQKEPELWNEGVGLVKDSSYMDEVRKNPYYSQLSEDDQLDEAIAMAIGDFGVKEIESKGVRGASLRAWIGKVWDRIRSFLGIPKREYKNLDDFARTALNDLLGGERVSEVVKDNKSNFQRTNDVLANEMQEIKRKAVEDNSFMKAPNGADTNLTERQWLQVRTKAFKNWFGNWEKKARIEKLRKSKTVEIIGNEIDPSDDLKQYKKNALEYGKRLQGHYINKDTGRSIQLQRGRKNGGLKEVLQHDITDIVHLQSVAAIPQIVESSIYIDSEENTDVKKNPNVSKYHYYVCGLRINGVDYTVRMVEAEEKNGSRYYDHKLTHIEKGKLIDELAFYKPSPTELSSTSGLGATNRNRPTDRGETLQAPISATKDNRLVSLLQVGEVSKVVDENGEPLVVDDLFLNTQINVLSSLNKKLKRAQKWVDAIKNAEKKYGLKEGAFEDATEEFVYATYEDDELKYYWNEDSEIHFLVSDLYNGRNPKVAIAFRYGDVPDEGVSRNHRDDFRELGVSMVGRVSELNTTKNWWYDSLYGEEDYAVFAGFDTGHHGSDGEMLLLGVKKLGAYKDIGDLVKSATDNVGSFDGDVEDIRYRNEERTPEQIVSENGSAYDALFDKAGVEKKAKSVVDKLSVPIDVKVRSKHEVPRSARNTKGYYDPKSGEVVVVLENVSSREDLEKTILHEVIGHKGLDALIPEADRDAFFNSVYNLLSEDQLLPIMARYPNAGKRELAEEFIAHLAEGYVHPTLITRVSKAIRNLLRSLGFNLRLTDGEVMTLLYRGSVALKRESATAAQEMAYINQDKAVSESMYYMDRLNTMSLDELRDEVGENGVKLAQRMRLLESLGESERLRYRADEAFKEIDVENVDRSAVADSMNKAFTGKKVGEHKIPTWTQFLEETQDDLISLRKYQENVEKSTGKKLPSYLNIDKVFNQMSSRAAAAEELLVDIFEKEVGGVIRKLEKEKKITYRDIQLYVMAKHAIERNQVKRQKEIEKLSNPTSGDIARIMQQDFSSELDIQYGIEKHLKGSKNPIFSNVDGIRSYIEAIENSAGKDIDALWSSINKLNGEALKMWHEAGMISKDHYNNIKKLYKYYVPLQGIDDETIEDVWTYYGVSNKGDYSLVKDAEGRSKLPDNPFMVMRKSISNTAYMAEHNKAKVVVLALAQTHPTDYLIVRNSWDILTTDANGREEWKEVMPESEEGAVTEESMIAFEEKMQALEEEGKARRHEHEPISNIGGYRVSNRNTLEEHLIRVSVNGKEQVVFVNGSPSFAQAVNRENRGKEREFLSKVAMVTRLKAAFATSLSIPFAFTNGVRDLLWSLSSSGIRYGKDYEVRFLRYYTKAGKFLFSPEAKRDEKMNLLWGEFKKNGGRTGYASMVGDENARKLAQKGLSRGIGKRGVAARAVNKVGNAISYLGETIEDLTRFAAYCAAREGGKSVTDSIDVAKEMTVNFNRRGKGSTLLMRSIFSFYMFINANIQGTTQLIKMFKNHPVGTSVMAGAYAMLPMFSAILTKLIGDDDDYLALSDYERTHNLIICLGSGKFIKVPMPQEMYPFLAIGNSISELAFGESSVTDALLGSVDGILDGATFGLDASSSSLKHFKRAVSKGEENPTYLLFRGFVPSILQPATDVWNNWDYVGRHIEKPSYGKNTPKYQRVYENKAWGWLVGLSKAINGDDIKGRAMQDDGIIGAINSPANAQYLIESWLGGIVSTIAKDVRFAEDLFRGENFFESASHAAVLGRFIHFDSHLQEKKMQSDFYKAKEEIGIAQKKINEIQKGIKANEEAISIYEEEGNYVMVGILEKEIEDAEADIMEITNGKDPELYKDASDMFKDYSKEQRQLRELLNSTTDEELRSEIQEQIYNSNEEIMGYYNELLSD